VCDLAAVSQPWALELVLERGQAKAMVWELSHPLVVALSAKGDTWG
jgi:hypothetical protein